MTIIWIILDDVSSLQHSRSEVSVWSAGSCYSYCGKCKGKKPWWKMLFIFRLLMSWLCQQFCLCILIHNFSLDFISCTSCSVDIPVGFYNLLFVFWCTCTSLLFLKMALSAGTPILRGYLSDLDCRWSVISGSVDDRTPEERGLEVSS